MVIFEIHYVTYAKSGGSAVTERHGGRIWATIINGRRNDLTIRKLLSLQKGSLRTIKLKFIKQSG